LLAVKSKCVQICAKFGYGDPGTLFVGCICQNEIVLTEFEFASPTPAMVKAYMEE
jgi:hypothetical protein